MTVKCRHKFVFGKLVNGTETLKDGSEEDILVAVFVCSKCGGHKKVKSEELN